MRRYRLSDLVVVLVIVGALSAAAVPVVGAFKRRSQLDGCRGNLRRLMAAMNAYSMTKWGRKYPDVTGGAFWEALWAPGRVDRNRPDTLWCPALGAGRIGAAHFRGPAEIPGPFEEFPPDRIVGVDRPENHEPDEALNVVTAAGVVFAVERRTNGYYRALGETRP